MFLVILTHLSKTVLTEKNYFEQIDDNGLTHQQGNLKRQKKKRREAATIPAGATKDRRQHDERKRGERDGGW
jgi:hypothetical protein